MSGESQDSQPKIISGLAVSTIVWSSGFLFLINWQFIIKIRRGWFKTAFLTVLGLVCCTPTGEDVAVGGPILVGAGLSGIDRESKPPSVTQIHVPFKVNWDHSSTVYDRSSFKICIWRYICQVKSRVRLFADDTAIYLSLSSEVESVTLQNDLHTPEIWEKLWGMSTRPNARSYISQEPNVPSRPDTYFTALS